MSILAKIRACFARWAAQWKARRKRIDIELGGNVDAVLPKVLPAKGNMNLRIVITPAIANAPELPWDGELASTVANGKVVREMVEQLAVALRKRNRVLQTYLMLPGTNVLCIKFSWATEVSQREWRPAGMKVY